MQTNIYAVLFQIRNARIVMNSKEWLKKEFDNGYVFRRIDERAKVFIEYGPAEKHGFR